MNRPKKNIYIALTLPFLVILVQILRQNPQWIEHYYSTGIYPYISKFLRFLLGWIPFSIGDLLIAFLLCYFLKTLYLLLKNKFKNILATFIKLMSGVSIIYFCFYAFWGLNYFREPLAKNLNLQQATYTTEQLVLTTKHIIEQLNAVHLTIVKNDSVQVVVPYTEKEIYKLAPAGFAKLSKSYPQLSYKTVSIKTSLTSLLQSYNGTAGYINPLTGEAQINDMIPKTGYPSTTCHEVAHQIGWAAENDANFIGFLASIANDDLYFKYSGYRMAYNYCIGQVYKRDKDLGKELAKTVNKGIYKDYKASNLHWQQFKNPIEPFVKKGYNSYLKANNQSKGIESYSYVVDLLIAYFAIEN